MVATLGGLILCLGTGEEEVEVWVGEAREGVLEAGEERVEREGTVLVG